MTQRLSQASLLGALLLLVAAAGCGEASSSSEAASNESGPTPPTDSEIPTSCLRNIDDPRIVPLFSRKVAEGSEELQFVNHSKGSLHDSICCVLPVKMQ